MLTSLEIMVAQPACHPRNSCTLVSGCVIHLLDLNCWLHDLSSCSLLDSLPVPLDCSQPQLVHLGCLLKVFCLNYYYCYCCYPLLRPLGCSPTGVDASSVVAVAVPRLRVSVTAPSVFSHLRLFCLFSALTATAILLPPK